MRVLHVISGGDTGGAKTHVLSLLKELNKHIDAEVACFLRGEFLDEARRLGVNCHLVEQQRRWDLGALSRLLRVFRDGNFDIWHAHGARANFLTVLLKPWLQVPILTTMHSDYRLDFEGEWYKYPVYTSLNAAALRLIDGYVAVSHSFREMLVSRGFDRDRIGVVYNGIDFAEKLELPAREEVLARFGLEHLAQEKLVGIVTRFHPVKGWDVFVEGARRIAEARDDVHFLVVGDGADRPEVERRISELGLVDRVHLLGYVDDPDAVINTFDINTLTSYSESFPFVLLEGARLSCPTVASRVGGVSRLVIDEETGLLFEAGDPGVFASRVLTLLAEPERAAVLGERLRGHAEAHYSVAAMADRQLAIYGRIVRGKRVSGERRIVLSGYYGYENSGDEAILETIIGNLRERAGDLYITALSGDPGATSDKYNIDAVPRLSFPALLRTIRRADLLLSGGGSLLQDVTSSRSLWYYLTVIKLAELLNKKVMVYANGLGPIGSAINRRLTRTVLEGVDYITLRDRESLDLLKELGLTNPPVELTADPVFTLPAPWPAKGRALLEAEGIATGNDGRETVGICLRPWKDQERVVGVVAQAADSLSRAGYQVVLFPMQHERDLPVLEQVAAAMQEPGDVVRVPHTAYEVLAITSRFDWVISMRLHTLIFAALNGIPMLGLVYDPKVRSFLDEVGQPGVNVDAMTPLALDGQFRYLRENRAKLVQALERGVHELRQRAERNALIAVQLLGDDRSDSARKPHR